MTSYTTLGLPYQTAADAPCDADEVWAEFVATLNGLLIPIDNSLDRVSPAVPAAKVFLSEPVVSTGDVAAVPFDAVAFDTDGMANTTRNPYGLTPQRLGNYLVVGYAVLTPTAASAPGMIMTQGPVLIVPGVSASYSSFGEDRIESNAATITYRRSATLYDWDAGSSVGLGMLISASSGTFTVHYAEVAAYWVSDAP